MKSTTKPEEPIKKEIKFVGKAEHWDSAMQSECKTRSGPPKVVSQSIGFTATRNEACGLWIRFQEVMQTAEECVAEAHGRAEQERGRIFGRATGVKFRLRIVVSARRHLATRQCHNKDANWWEFVTARITDLTRQCQRAMVSRYQIRFAAESTDWLGRRNGERPSDDGWTKEQWEQILINPLESMRWSAPRHAPREPRRRSGRWRR